MGLGVTVTGAQTAQERQMRRDRFHGEQRARALRKACGSQGGGR